MSERLLAAKDVQHFSFPPLLLIVLLFFLPLKAVQPPWVILTWWIIKKSETLTPSGRGGLVLAAEEEEDGEEGELEWYLAQRRLRGNVLVRIMSNCHPSIRPSPTNLLSPSLKQPPQWAFAAWLPCFPGKLGPVEQQWLHNLKEIMVFKVGTHFWRLNEISDILWSECHRDTVGKLPFQAGLFSFVHSCWFKGVSSVLPSLEYNSCSNVLQWVELKMDRLDNSTTIWTWYHADLSASD